jgi:hypothetical protein
LEDLRTGPDSAAELLLFGLRDAEDKVTLVEKLRILLAHPVDYDLLDLLQSVLWQIDILTEVDGAAKYPS